MPGRLLLSTLSLLGLLLGAVPASAALVSYAFSFTIAGGSLDGSSQSGTYGYDGADLTGSGDEFLSLSSLSFDFNGYSFGSADDSSATVDFSDGLLLGLTYNAGSATPDQTVSFQSGFFDITEQTFTYELASVPQGGAGDTGNEITTTLVTNDVPVPGPLWLSLLPLAWVLRTRGRRSMSRRLPWRLVSVALLVVIGVSGCENDEADLIIKVAGLPEAADSSTAYAFPVSSPSSGMTFELNENDTEEVTFWFSNDYSDQFDDIRITDCPTFDSDRFTVTETRETLPEGLRITCSVKVGDLSAATLQWYPIIPGLAPWLSNDTPFPVEALGENDSLLQTFAPSKELSALPAETKKLRPIMPGLPNNKSIVMRLWWDSTGNSTNGAEHRVTRPNDHRLIRFETAVEMYLHQNFIRYGDGSSNSVDRDGDDTLVYLSSDPAEVIGEVTGYSNWSYKNCPKPIGDGVCQIVSDISILKGLKSTQVIVQGDPIGSRSIPIY